MAEFTVMAKRTTYYEDVVEADSLEEAEVMVDDWIDEDFTIAGNSWYVEVV